MYTPLISDTTYLIDRQGCVVHTWKSDYAPCSEYLLADGLIRGARVPDAPRFYGGYQCLQGELLQKVYDVARSDDRKTGKGGQLQSVGSTVDLTDASYSNSIGAAELSVTALEFGLNLGIV